MRAHRYRLIPESLDTGDALRVVLRAPVAQQLLNPVGQLLARCQGYKTMIIKANALTTKPAANIQKQHRSMTASVRAIDAYITVSDCSVPQRRPATFSKVLQTKLHLHYMKVTNVAHCRRAEKNKTEANLTLIERNGLLFDQHAEISRWIDTANLKETVSVKERYFRQY